jgi:hypothetical protein
VEFIRYIWGDGDTTTLNMRWYIRIYLLDGVFSHMVDKKSGGDKEKMVKVEGYGYIITN